MRDRYTHSWLGRDPIMDFSVATFMVKSFGPILNESIKNIPLGLSVYLFC